MAHFDELVTDEDRLHHLLDELEGVDRYGLDTEFHRERTYFPKAALVQLAWRDAKGAGRVVLLDPLAVDLAPLARLIESDALAIMHASRQDLEVLVRLCGVIPGRLFDTQIAAGFVGYTTPSLAALVEGELKLHLPKGDRLTDWLRRPLSESQLNYAASDVEFLLELHDRLVGDLDRRGRRAWAEAACEELRGDGQSARAPEEAWRRIKEARQLRGEALACLQALAGWREKRAAALDIPTRFVISDLALCGIAQTRPTSQADLGAIRGVDARSLRPEMVDEILCVVSDSAGRRPVRDLSRTGPDVPTELRAAVPLLSAWIAQTGRALDLDPALVATRLDIEEFLGSADGGRLATGWRAEVAGEPIRRLITGRAALAFERDRGLVLEDRDPDPGR